MTSLPAPPNRLTLDVPQWAIELYTTKYSNDMARPHPLDPEETEDGDVDADFDTRRCGWLCLFADGNKDGLRLMDISVKWDIRDKPTGELVVDSGCRWMMGLDMVNKCKSLFFYPQTLNFDLPEPSRVVCYVDTSGIPTAECYPSGTIRVEGIRASDNADVTEVMDMYGWDAYITNTEFTRIKVVSVEYDEYDVGGHRATMSVWAKYTRTVGIREIRLWCDANQDNVYGCTFGGYVKARYGEINYEDYRSYYDLVGYAEALQTNEYVAGYRSSYRCTYFDTSGSNGLYGACTHPTYASTNFRAGGSSCYVGDWQTCHPNWMLVSDAGYYCPGFDPDTTQRLPYDGWTYDSNYAPSTSPYYEWYPPTYFRALMAVCNMMNSIEEGKPVSRPWSLPMYSVRELAAEVDGTAGNDIIYLKSDLYYRGGIPEMSYIIVEDEIMKVSVESGLTLGVMRGVDNTLVTTHPAGTKVYVPLVAWSTDGNPPPLVREEQLQGPNLKHTVYDTLCSLAENATSQSTNAVYVGWVDCYRQIHLTEMDLDRPAFLGWDDAFTITPDDIIEMPSYILTEVVNRICAQVDITDQEWVYCEKSTDSSDMSDYVDSMRLFGNHSEDVSNCHLNAIKPTTGKVDFDTYATNYLKFNSFPRLIQHIAIRGLIPDEHYWEWVAYARGTDPNAPYYHWYDPYFAYTDPQNYHINLLGTKIRAPDFWLGKDPTTGEWPISDFIVEAIRWVSKVSGDRAFVTYLQISRPTLPSEWVSQVI